MIQTKYFIIFNLINLKYSSHEYSRRYLKSVPFKIGLRKKKLKILIFP